MMHRRWEHGSEFHSIDIQVIEQEEMPWGADDYSYCATGRMALLVILRDGMNRSGWRRLFVPSYYCPDVLKSLSSTGIEIRTYPHHPDQIGVSPIERLNSTDVVLHVNIFGLCAGESTPRYGRDVTIIEDHTHDPWSAWAYNSRADWCFASLRKTLPLPDGAVLWSPRKIAVPDVPKLESTHPVYIASLEKLASMSLKSYYLQGFGISKEVFRDLAMRGEASLADDSLVSMSEWSRELLKFFPWKLWRQLRRRNWGVLTDVLAETEACRILMPSTDKKVTPFSIIVTLPSNKVRECVRNELLRIGIYPSILWKVEEYADKYRVSNADTAFSRRMLSFHCDMRYTDQEMMRVGMTILDVISKCAPS